MPIRLDPNAPANAPLFEGMTPGEFAHAFRLTPEGAAGYLANRSRIRITYDWHELWQDEHARQFTVSRLARADLVEGIRQRIVASVNGDLSRRDWFRDVTAMMKEAGWWGEKQVQTPDGRIVTTRFNPRRLKTIYEVNTRMAYAAGRWERIQAAKETHPFLRYVTRQDERVRQSHAQWHDVTLPVDHPWWRTHYPPCGWRCRCRAVALTQAEYDRRKGLKKHAPDEPLTDWTNPKTGEVKRVPFAVDPGFDYNVGDAHLRWQDLAKVIADRLPTYPAGAGAQFWHDPDLPDALRAAHRQAWEEFLAAAISGRARPNGALMVVGAIHPETLRRLVASAADGARPIIPATAEIAIRDRDIAHLLRDAKLTPITEAWLRGLPDHLRTPTAVLLDQTHNAAPALLYVFDQPGATKLVVRINYRTRRDGEINLIGSGRSLDDKALESIRGSVGTLYELLEGSL